jgi:hypothetical protein
LLNQGNPNDPLKNSPGKKEKGESNRVIWFNNNTELKFTITRTGATAINLSANQAWAEIEGYYFDDTQTRLIKSLLFTKIGIGV